MLHHKIRPFGDDSCCPHQIADGQCMSMQSVRNRCQIHFQCDKHNKREKTQYSIYVFFIRPDGSFLFFYGVWSIHVFPQDVFPSPATRVAASSAHLPPLPVATGARRSSASWGHKEDVDPQPGSTYQALVALTPVKSSSHWGSSW